LNPAATSESVEPPSGSGVTVERLVVRRDPRGCVIEPLDPDRLPAQRNVHVVVSEPGAIRGNHYHQRGTEVLAVYGPALVRTRVGAEVTDAHVPDGEVWRFQIQPGVSHAVRNTGTAPALLVAFNTEEHDVVADAILTS
jgi:dTDP-4-dehydrorhamnose 3,5-epimerase-like enzyme